MKSIILFLLILLNAQNCISQLRSLPAFTLHDNWYYSYTKENDTLVLSNQNEIWEYTKDTLINSVLYKLIEAKLYNNAREITQKEYFLFNIQDSKLNEFQFGTLYDSTFQIGAFRVSTLLGYRIWFSIVFGEERLACQYNYDYQIMSGGHIGADIKKITTLAVIGIDTLKTFNSAKGPGFPYTFSSTIRILRGALLNGTLYGDTSFITTSIETTIFSEKSRAILIECYPNPFNSSTVIIYKLPKSGSVILTVRNILGQIVGSYLNEYQEEGNHEWPFNSKGLPSGVYFASIRFENINSIKKILLIK